MIKQIFGKGGGAKRPPPTAGEIEASKEAVRKFNDHLEYGVPLQDKAIEGWTTNTLNADGSPKTDVGSVNAEVEAQRPAFNPNKSDYSKDIAATSIKAEHGNKLMQQQRGQYDRGLLAASQLGAGIEVNAFNAGQDLANRNSRDVIRDSQQAFNTGQQRNKNIGAAFGYGLGELEERYGQSSQVSKE